MVTESATSLGGWGGGGGGNLPSFCPINVFKARIDFLPSGSSATIYEVLSSILTTYFLFHFGTLIFQNDVFAPAFLQTGSYVPVYSLLHDCYSLAE